MKQIKSPQVSRPLVALGVIFRDNADTLPSLLESVAGHFDQYVFTDTGSVDGSRELVDAFLRKNRGKVNDFVWCDDFAAARNANKAMATAEFYMFLDSDDILLNGQNVRPVCQRLMTPEAVQGHIDGCFVPYHYDVDEELGTMRLCRNNKDWMFRDAIHERLSCDDAPYNVQFGTVRDFSVLHKRKTSEEKKKALYRNAAIAEVEYKKTNDKAYKARLARTMAMIPMAEGRLDDALPLLQECGEGYPELPEGRQAFATLSRILASKDQVDTALAFAKKAGPSYEAIVHRARNELKEVIERQTRAIVIPQQTTHEGFLFEHCVAPIVMADAAMELGYEPRQIEQVLNGVRGDLRQHEAVRDAVADIRATIDRVTIVVPLTPQPFDGNSGDSMLGGSEEAVLYLSKALAKQGRNVRVYGVLPPLTISGTVIDGVEWRRYSEFNPADEHGTLVLWRAPGLVLHLADQQASARTKRAKGDETARPFYGIGHTSLWLHDRHLGLPKESVEAKVLGRCVDEIVVLSQFHEDTIRSGMPDGANAKFVQMTNGINGDDFRALRRLWPERDPNRVVYSSCPSRGLEVLLDAWPQIKAECPDAYLDIYYDWSQLEREVPPEFAKIKAKYQAVQHLNVKHHGGVGHQTLHEALTKANVWAYAHFRNVLAETSCISAMKATAAGAHVITARNGALPETVPTATFVEEQDYAKAVIEAIKNPMSVEERTRLSDLTIERFDWVKVAAEFSSLWTVRK